MTKVRNVTAISSTITHSSRLTMNLPIGGAADGPRPAQCGARPAVTLGSGPPSLQGGVVHVPTGVELVGDGLDVLLLEVDVVVPEPRPDVTAFPDDLVELALV